MIYDLIIIGAGPGGYTGAIRAAQLGLKTAVIEKDNSLGGTCLNVGCIPSKALLDSSEHYFFAKNDMDQHGVNCKFVSLNLKTMMNRKSNIVKELTQGVQYLFKKNKIERLEGVGSLISPNQVQIQKGSNSQIIEGKHIMLATGSVPNELPNIALDGDKIISSTEALKLTEAPKKMLIIGGGYIGLEMGSVWSRLGSEVLVIEYASRLCPAMDEQLSKGLLQVLKKQGIQFLMESTVQEVKTTRSSVELIYQDKSKTNHSIKGDIALLAVGRKAYSQSLGLDKAGIQTDEKGFIPVDQHWRTKTHPHIFAIGDLIGGVMLAHKAEEEGVAVAETIAGSAGHVNYHTIPSVIYTWPEVASVGKTEAELKKEGREYRSGQFPFTANGRAKALGFTQGFVKILADTKTDQILGVHILGPRASDMIAEAVVTMEFGGSSEDLARSFHAHPTLSEVMREAALNVDKRARQI